MVWWIAFSQYGMPMYVSSLESGNASTSRQLHWQVYFRISTLVCRSLAATAPVYVAAECTLVTVAGHCPLRSADNQTCVVKRSCNQFGDRYFVTTKQTLWNSQPGLNSFDNRTRLSNNSNNRCKRLCLVRWVAAPCVWTLRALTRNLLTYLLTCLENEEGMVLSAPCADTPAHPVNLDMKNHVTLRR